MKIGGGEVMIVLITWGRRQADQAVLHLGWNSESEPIWKDFADFGSSLQEATSAEAGA